MKKNKMMRVASFLLVAVLLSTSIISGTFAKYVTADEVKDNARVAKFGVVVAGTGYLFGTDYNKAENNHPLDTWSTGDDADGGKKDPSDAATLTVETSNGDKLVAPGTKNEEGVTFSVTGTPEVDVRVSVNVADTLKDVFLASAKDLPDMTTGKEDATFDFPNVYDYYPIVYTLKGDFIKSFADDTNFARVMQFGDTKYPTYGVSGTVDCENGIVKGNLIQIAAVLNYMFKSGEYADQFTGIEGYYVDANTDLADVIGELTLTWEWQFEDKDDDGNVIALQDQQDTLLGDLAAFADLDTDNIPAAKMAALEALHEDTTAYNLTAVISLTIAVTQVD